MKSHNYLYTLLLAAIIAGGCKVSKDVAKPADAVPVTFRGTQGTDTVSVATLGLKEFISEPDIQKLIDTALVKNYDLQLAVKNIEA
jgi:multidrug efflux system outer membrane protein